MSVKKWLSTGYFQSRPAGKISAETGTIEAVSVCTTGEAKGHGVFLDESFIDAVVSQGNEKASGIKARFGHPNMCSTALGTFIGRFKNFRREAATRNDGSQAWRAVADLFMSNSAKDTPNGNLYDYVFKLAESESDMFGTSIVFTPGREYRKQKDGSPAFIVYETDEMGRVKYNSDGLACLAYVDKDGKPVDAKDGSLSDEVYVECGQIHACDAVDDPAANDGLFSKFSNETAAGQITEFLDLHPEVFKAVSENPSIMESLVKYGDKIEEFISNYREYRGKKTGDTKIETNTGAEALEATNPVKTPDEPKPVEAIAAAEAVVEQVPEQKPTAEAAKPQVPEVVQQEEAHPVVKPDDRAEFKRMRDDFGAEIAAAIFSSGGSYSDALKLAYELSKKEVEKLKSQFPAAAGGQPAQFLGGGREKPSDSSIKAEYDKLTDPIERARFRQANAEALGITK